MSKICINCGQDNDDIAKFCINCHGIKFKKIEMHIFENNGNIALEEIKKLSASGSNNASYFLGKIYLFGLYNVKQNIEKAKRIFTDLGQIGYKKSYSYLQICGDSLYDIKKILLKQNKRTFPAYICKNCESIIPIIKLESNSHRTIQVYGTSLLETLGTQALMDTFFSTKHLACPYCFQEDLLMLGTPLAESLIKKHSDNKDYQNVLLSEYAFDIPIKNIDKKLAKKTNNVVEKVSQEDIEDEEIIDPEDDKKTERLFYAFLFIIMVIGMLMISYLFFKPGS